MASIAVPRPPGFSQRYKPAFHGLIGVVGICLGLLGSACGGGGSSSTSYPITIAPSNPTLAAAAKTNASSIHAGLASSFQSAVVSGDWTCGLDAFQKDIVGPDAAHSKVPAIWKTKNPFEKSGVPMGFNTSLIAETGADGAATCAAATPENLGQVQVGYCPSPDSGGSGFIVTAVYLPDSFVDAKGRTTHVFSKVTALQDPTQIRDAAAKANAVHAVEHIEEIYQQAMEWGYPVDTPVSLDSLLRNGVAQNNNIPTMPELNWTLNPWRGIGKAPRLGFSSTVNYLYAPAGNLMDARLICPGASALGQVFLGFQPPDLAMGTPVLIAAVVYLKQPFKDEWGSTQHVFAIMHELDLNILTRDKAAKANATNIIGKVVDAYYRGQEAGAPVNTPADLWNLMTTNVAPFPEPLVPEVLQTLNPWACLNDNMPLGYYQGVMALPDSSVASARAMVSPYPMQLGQVVIGFLPPDLGTGQCGAVAVAVQLEQPINDPYAPQEHTFVAIQLLDRDVLARDSQAKVNASSILDDLATQYYQAQDAGLPLAAAAAFQQYAIGSAMDSRTPAIWSALNPWPSPAPNQMAYNPVLATLPNMDVAAMGFQSNPTNFGQVQLSFLPADPSQSQPAVLASSVYLFDTFLDPLTQAPTHVYVQWRVLNSQTGTFDDSAKANAENIHTAIINQFKTLKANGLPVGDLAGFQANVIGASALTSRVPAVWMTANPWRSIGPSNGYETTVAPEITVIGSVTESLATISNLGQVQIGYLPATADNPAVLITAVYLWDAFKDVDGTDTHVFVKISNLE
jgi:hypothetical protein